MTEKYDLIVIGGGAAGLMAAGQAASLNARTLILEKMDEPGRKIFITGKFRCNLTNTAPIPEFIDHFGVNGPFLRQAFHRFFSYELRNFFEELGVPTVAERGGRVFPKSGQSKDIVHALVRFCQRYGVETQTHSPVTQLVINGDQIQGVITPSGEYNAKNVIVATGGASYPGTGSTGDGFKLAETAGHKLIPIRPALVPLVTAGDIAQKMQGVSLKNVRVMVWVDGKKSGEAFGEMLFTHFGISGPIILGLSRDIVDGLHQNANITISIDLKPALNENKLDARLQREFNAHGKKQFQSVLRELLPRKMIPVCVEQTKIPEEKLAHQITADERGRLRNWLKDFQLTVVDHRSFRHAIVTAGGVDTREINPRTMESKIVSGLYFAGEVIDIDADTGGFNLQAAFSTGWLAGQSVANTLFKEKSEKP